MIAGLCDRRGAADMSTCALASCVEVASKMPGENSSEQQRLLNDSKEGPEPEGANGTHDRPSNTVHTATVKSSDGKFHRMTFDVEKNVIEFTLITDSAGHTTEYSMLVGLNEVLAVKGKRIKLRHGLPVNLEPNLNCPPNHLYIYLAVKKNKYKWRVREITVIFTTTSEKKLWCDLLQGSIRELVSRPKNLIVFINPFGGKGRAKQIYERQVQLLFEMAEINCEKVLTERANHAFDVLTELPADKWGSIDGVVSVGGDGLFNEVLCSGVKRAQLEAGKDIADINISSLSTPRMRFGIIGAGSANSIVSSVHGIDDCPTAAIHIAIGSQCSVDVATVHEGATLLRISANAISYGWLGDVLRDSERYRFMGPVRYQWSALRTTIRHPKYFGRVDFRLSSNCTQPCTRCENADAKDDLYPYHLTSDFTHLICCVIPCVSPFTPYGLAPFAGVGDGSMDLAMVPRVSRCANLDIMRKVSLYGGKGLFPLDGDVNVFRVSGFSFTPAKLLRDEAKYADENKQGAWNLDGEILPQPADKALHFRLHPRLITYFGREMDLTNPAKRRCLCCCRTQKKISNIIIIN
uniref:DAGKc domain-containing protein n=1 Tax=Steinernema glaseri TaxID=37863 RepID=A0A1I8AGY8_9BILA